jgi:hypothetical protein
VTQSGSSDESASKKPKITGTTYLTTTDFTTSIKVDVEKSVLEGETKGAQWYDETEEEKVEKTRAKEAREAKKNEANKEAREGVQNAIEEANLFGKEAKEMARELKEEKKVARNLVAALEVPKSKGRGSLGQRALRVASAEATRGKKMVVVF